MILETSTTRPKMIPLSELIQMYGEQATNNLVQSYVSAHESENPEISVYLRQDAIMMEKKDLSRTYIGFRGDSDNEILGFVTLGVKCMTIPPNNTLSNSTLKRMNIESETGVAQAFLLGQLSRSEDSIAGIGRELAAFALERLGEAKKIVGCRMVRLDCKDDLVSYYEGLGFNLVGKNEAKNLNQMIRFIE